MRSVLPISTSPHPTPAGVVTAAVNLRLLADRSHSEEWEDCYPYLANAVRSRKLGHHGGRVCAAVAIAALSADRRCDGPLAQGSVGEPIWPKGLVGSITHTDEFACAAVAPVSICAGIGIDSERCVDDDTCEAISEICLSPDERRRFLGESTSARCWAATAIFCIKEAFYKAVYPQVRRFVDFEELAITDLNMALGQVQASIRLFGIQSKLRFIGRFAVHGGHVHACVSLHQK